MAVVAVACGCERQYAVEEMYFCAVCHEINCVGCTSSELAMYYCPACLGGMAPSEAALFGGRCSKCLSCPSCGLALHTRQSSAGTYHFVCQGCRWNSVALGLEHEEADALVVEAVQRERSAASASAEPFQQLLDRYTRRAREEAVERDRQQRLITSGINPASVSTHAVSEPQLEPTSILELERRLQEREQDRSQWTQYGVGAVNPDFQYTYTGLAVEQKQVIESAFTFNDADESSSNSDSDSDAGIGARPVRKTKEQIAAEAREAALERARQAEEEAAQAAARAAANAEEAERAAAAVEAALTHVILDPYRGWDGSVAPAKLTSLAQRYTNIESQPRAFADVYPERVPLLTRLKRRCRRCEQLLVRPVTEVSNARFKIIETAAQHVPVVRLGTVTRDNGMASVVAVVVNPLDSVMEVTLTPAPPAEVVVATAADDIDLELERELGGTGGRSATYTGSATGSDDDERDHLYVIQDKVVHSCAVPVTCHTTLADPQVVFHIEPHVDLAEEDMWEPEPSPLRAETDPPSVLRRVRNKVWFSLDAKHRDGADPDEPWVVGIDIAWRYLRLRAAAAEPEEKNARIRVLLRLPQ